MASPAVMSSESAKTFGFMMRPAVCSSYSSRSPTSSPGPFPDQLEHGGRDGLGQVVDDRRRIVGRQIVQEPRDVLGRSIGQQRRAPLRAQLAQRFHRELAVAIDQEGEGGVPVLFAEIAEDLREIGGVLLVEQVDEIRRRAEANQALHRIEDDVNLALRHRDPPNLPRD